MKQQTWVTEAWADGDDGWDVVSIIREDSVRAAVTELAEHYLGLTDATSHTGPPWGSADQTASVTWYDTPYVLAWNDNLGYASLNRRI